MVILNIMHLLGAVTLPRDPDRSGTSGVTRVVLEVARIQASHGHNVSIVIVSNDAWKEQWRGVELVSIKPFPVGELRMGEREIDLRGQIALMLFCLRRRIDVVHSHLYSYLRFIPARGRVVHFHGDPYFKGGMPHEQLDYKPEDFTTVAKYSDAQIGVSEFVSGELRRGMGEAGNIYTVPNGIDAERFGSEAVERAGQVWREERGIPQGAITILFAGAITPEKGPLHLARVFQRISAQFKDVHLLLAGSTALWGRGELSNYRRRYEDEIHTILRDMADKVHFLGSVTAISMPVVYAACDMVVMPSTVREGWPLVALEALASGRPIVASRIGGIPEIVNESCGFLVTPEDENELETALVQLIEDVELREKLGRAGRQRAAKFSWERTAEQIEAIYRSVLDSK